MSGKSDTVPPRINERSPADLIDVHEVARRLSISSRTVYRLCDARKLPGRVKLGALVRWRLTDIEEWIAQGCPAMRHMGGGSK